MDRLTVLGSTGSIGRQTLELAAAKNIEICALSAGKNARLAEEQARRFCPALFAMADTDAANELKIRLADTGIRVFSGPDGILEMLERSEGETVVNAITGSAGLKPTLAAIEQRRRLALANKESLVMAGKIVTASAAEHGVTIRPVDSEHSAIWQCLRAGKPCEVKKLVLTASGGPFFGLDRGSLKTKTLSDALAHPTWKMGRGITVDSATLMNKGFEVIEAAHLFGVPGEKIEVVIHRESIIHSMVEYIDNSVMAQLSVPDMRMCINYALTYPRRAEGVSQPLDLTGIGRLTFSKPDTVAFPLLDCAYDALRAGGALPAVLHAANEAAVGAFLDERIGFTDIDETVRRVTDGLSGYSAYDTL